MLSVKEILVIAPFDLNTKQIQRLEQVLFNPSYKLRFLETKIPYTDNLTAIKKTTGAIVSRGGLGELLQRKSDLPFINIPITPFDLLRALIHASSLGYKRIKIMFFAGIFYDTESIFAEFDSLHIEVVTYRDPEFAKESIRKNAVNSEIDIIIGDRLCTDTAKEFKLASYLVKSGEEALIFAVNQAFATLDLQVKEQAKHNELESILQVVPKAVVNLNEKNEIKLFNEKAKSLFPKLNEPINKRSYPEVFDSEELHDHLKKLKPQRNILTNINNVQFLVTTMPIFSEDIYQGVILTFERLIDIQTLELKIRKELHKQGLVAKHTFEDIIYESDVMRKLVNDSAAYARSEGPVLIYGETGTGKELIAQSIHNASKRKNKPFVSINCGALNESLLESELFGYEEGAFTGALKGGRSGLFELAHEGTLFFDEINEMSLNFQTKLLRVLQEKEVRRVGGMKYIPINVRIICASNQPMDALIDDNKFKKDLFYRISTLTVDLPPLRARKEDIAPIAMHFFEAEMKSENRYLKLEEGIKTLEPLVESPWYGNGRELQNIIQRIIITYPDHKVTKKGISKYLDHVSNNNHTITIPLANTFKEMESSLWIALYDQFQGNKQEFCDFYNISSTTLWRKTNYYGS